MTDLSHRERHQVPNHLRPIAVQQLDALLRIEELLSVLISRLPPTEREELEQLVAAEKAAKDDTEGKPAGRRRRN